MALSVHKLVSRLYPLRSCVVFGLLWVLVFLLYLPAAQAGFVTDFTGWLDQVKNHSFYEFINRTNFQARSLYQLTQLLTWFFYQVFGCNRWLWHLLFVSLQALNGLLLFRLAKGLLQDAGMQNGEPAALTGALLFSLTPYISEVVVWEPSFHFLLGLLLMLVVLNCARLYQQTFEQKYAVRAWLIYGLSLFSLEVFYLTPLLVLALVIYYKANELNGRPVLRRGVLRLFVPLLILFALRMVLYKLFAGEWVSRVGSDTISSVKAGSLGKPLKYLFHLLALGRFWPDDQKNSFYNFADAPEGIILFYGLLALAAEKWIRGFRKMGAGARVAGLLGCWMLSALFLLIPLWFTGDMLVVYDRYLYVAGSFFYMLLAVCLFLVPVVWLRMVLLAVYALANLRFTILVSRYWGKSARVVNRLLYTVPQAPGKIILLLNIPQNLHGVPMIGAERNSEFRLMHDLLLPGQKFTGPVYDVLAYNMLTPGDGANVEVVNDSLLKVTLNQWATWWWFETRGANSYDNEVFRLNLRDPGHWYELTLRQPADKYLILYSVGDQWKQVDMKRRDVQQ